MEKLLKIKPPAIALMCLLLAFLFNKCFPISQKIQLPWNLVGLVILCVGFGFVLSAFQLFLKKKNPILPTDQPKVFIASGPYRFTRNPMYLGMCLILCGVVTLVGTIVMLFAPVAFVILISNIHIPHEEKNLEKVFGKEYVAFKQKVRRWI